MGYRLALDKMVETYTGDAECCIATFEGFTTADALANEHIDQIRNQGGTPLRVVVYHDANTNRWRTFSYAHGSPLLIPIWTLIIYAIIAALLITLIVFAIRSISESVGKLLYGPGYSPASGTPGSGATGILGTGMSLITLLLIGGIAYVGYRVYKGSKKKV